MANSIPTWCWYCKQQIPSQAEVCPSCGQPLTDAKKVVRCHRCGKFLLKASGRCSQCGEPLPMDAPPQQMPPMPGAPQQPMAAAPMPGPQQPIPEAPMPYAAPGPDAPMADGMPQEQPPMPDPGALGAAQGQPPLPENPDMQETLRALEQLEAQESQQVAAQASSSRKIIRIAIIIAAVALIALAAVYFFTRPKADKTPEETEPPAPAVCADDAHQWVEADCTHPRTCSVCGTTEGEPLGHHYIDNVCVICGEYKKPFFFTDADCLRDGSTVVFWGNVQNFTGLGVQNLQLKLDLYDKDMNLVAEEEGYTVVGGATMAPLETIRWEMRYDDSETGKWKYWRISAIDYTPAIP